MAKVKACYSCAQHGVWGPYHVLVPGPGEVKIKRHDHWEIIEHRDRTKDKTLCGMSLTDMWERDVVGINPGCVECKRCRAILKKQGKLDKHTRLVPESLRSSLPALGEQENVDDPVIHVKYFAGDWTWYATEGEKRGDDWMFFGLVKGAYAELGFFTASELENVRYPFGGSVRIDGHFTPKPLSDVSGRPSQRRQQHG